jgi:hypothetical protein
VRLRPSAFPNLPSAVRDELEHRGCAIPQPFGENRPRNVVSGSFIAAGQTDWAFCAHVTKDQQFSYLVADESMRWTSLLMNLICNTCKWSLATGGDG